MKSERIFTEKITSKDDLDIGIYFCGKREKTQNHVYGPEIRPYFLVVLVTEGEAELLGETVTKIKKDDILVMFPDERIHYRALGEWSIMWLGVDGTCLEHLFSEIGITRKHPITSLKNADILRSLLTDIYAICDTSLLSEKLKCRSLVSMFFSELVSLKDTESDAMKSIALLMDYNFSENINMDFLAGKANMCKTAFSRKFKDVYGISPKEYLTMLRINKAKEMLRTTDFEIKEIAASVGYRDQLYFSRLFSRKEGLSPSDYRRSDISEHLL